MISARDPSKLLALVTVALLVSTTRCALACGASAGGAAGLSACSVDEHDEEVRPKWHAAVDSSLTLTAIHFDDGSRFEQQRFHILATLDAMPVPKLALQIGAGFAFPGTMNQGSESFTTDAGVVMALGASYRFVDAKGARPFVLGTLGLTFLAMQTESALPANSRALYDAFDIRIGAAVGWVVLDDAVTPYLVARAFGGPVYWKRNNADVTGTDVNHYQLGGGASFKLGRVADLFIEGVPLGEQGMSGGIGASF